MVLVGTSVVRPLIGNGCPSSRSLGGLIATDVAFSVHHVNVVSPPDVTVAGLALKLVITGGRAVGGRGAALVAPNVGGPVAPGLAGAGALGAPEPEAAGVLFCGTERPGVGPNVRPPQPVRKTRQEKRKQEERTAGPRAKVRTS